MVVVTRHVPDFSHLLAPAQIGKHTCQNRVKYAACSGHENASDPYRAGAVAGAVEIRKSPGSRVRVSGADP